MTHYTTQMDAARQGIITPQMEIVAEKEHFDVEELRELIAKGQVIIPCNKNHKSISPSGVGAKLTTKINVNLGVSRDWKDVDMEYEKVHSAVEMGAEAIMDLSSYGDTRSFRRKLTAECPAMIGTVPIYDAVVYYHKALGKITSEEWIDIVRMHAEDGVDFMTIHCGMNRATAARFKQNKRLMNIVSRGGSIMFAWMEMTGKENPFYEHFDEILDICREYDITLSLGDACRPGCLADATDTAQIEELITICIPIQLFADRQNSLWVFRIADGGKECICQTKYLCLFFVEGKVVFCGKGIADRIRKHLPILRDFADKAQSLRNEKPLLIAIFLYF